MAPVKILHRIRGRRFAGLVVALVAVVATAGCAGSSPDVAAYVGQSSISDSHLHRVTVAADTALGYQGQTGTAGVLNGLVLGEIADQVARDRGLRISDSERDALVSPSNLGPLLRNDEARELAYGLATAELVRMRIGDQAFVAAITSAPVRVNPRYGTWQPDAYAQGGSMVGAGSESLSVPRAQQP
jgi:hypothetical protein